MTHNPTICAALLAATLSQSACMGRTPQPVPTVQPADHFAGCPAIMAESAGNTAKLGELGSEQGAKVAQNVAAGVAGLFIPVLWFAMDFQGAASTESAALLARQQYLAGLAGEKHCSV